MAFFRRSITAALVTLLATAGAARASERLSPALFALLINIECQLVPCDQESMWHVEENEQDVTITLFDVPLMVDEASFDEEAKQLTIATPTVTFELGLNSDSQGYVLCMQGCYEKVVRGDDDEEQMSICLCDEEYRLSDPLDFGNARLEYDEQAQTLSIIMPVVHEYDRIRQIPIKTLAREIVVHARAETEKEEAVQEPKEVTVSEKESVDEMKATALLGVEK